MSYNGNMDRRLITTRSELECILLNESAKPKAIQLSLLMDITNNFSNDNVIGSGGFAVVYKGMLDNGIVAVKKLSETLDINDKRFRDEIGCLMKVKHKNIVRCLGLCADTQGEMLENNGEFIMLDVRERLLCFEYLPNGSLDKKITDASTELEWSKRYKIIIGICDGLYYLHDKNILHLDLKPGNILIDDSMIPKIADFGLSRCFDEDQSFAITSKAIGTKEYMAPEFIREKLITYKYDIYSLGIIIIEMVTGNRGRPQIHNVLEWWRSRLETMQEVKQLKQIRVCTEIGMQCTRSNPEKRPDIKDIVVRLGATKCLDDFGTENMTVVPPAGPTIRENEGCSSIPEDTYLGEITSDAEEEKIKIIRMTGDNKVIKNPDIIDETTRTSNLERKNKPAKQLLDDKISKTKQVIDFTSTEMKKQYRNSGTGMTGSVHVVTIKHMEKAPLFDHNTQVMLELTGGDYTSARPGLDLVAVLDVTSIWVMKDMKNAMQFVLQKLGLMDRLSIVTFDSEGATKLCPLRQINEASRQEWQELIDRLENSGGYSGNIADGLESGLKVLENRKVNDGRVTAIMLVARDSCTNSKVDKGRYSDVPVYTFGLSSPYGNYNDYTELGEVAANSMGGTFSFVPLSEDTDDGLTIAISQCLAGLLTVVVRDLELTVAAVRGESMLLKVTAGSYPQRHDGGSVTVRFGHLYSREVRKVIVDLGLPTISSERSAELLSVTYSYSRSGSSSGRVEHVVPVETLTVWRTGAEEVSQEEVTPAEFQMEEDRLRTTQMMEDHNMRLSVPIKKKKKTILSRLWSSDKHEEEAQHMQVQAQNMQVDPLLKIELMQFLADCRTPRLYEELGRSYLLSSRSSHGRQRFAARGNSESMRLFATPRMDMYLDQAKRFIKYLDVRLEQAKRFIQYPEVRLPSTDQDDVASSEHPMIYDAASREEELRVLRLTVED
ncbi:unnamed protein product [Alopecurus aequalis]